VRSEEELRVGKREREAGRLQLRKWVETEQVEVPMEVRREKACVTREPVDGNTSSEEIGDESIEVTLREEEPVVQKQTVAKERIGIEKTSRPKRRPSTTSFARSKSMWTEVPQAVSRSKSPRAGRDPRPRRASRSSRATSPGRSGVGSAPLRLVPRTRTH
jgi:uncharacterized protein (TIGR02271 family)